MSDRAARRAARAEMGRRGGRPIGEHDLVDAARLELGGSLAGAVSVKVDMRGVNSESAVYVQDMDDLLVKMARMQRDGWSIDRIRVEVNVPRYSMIPGASVPEDRVFQAAIDRGHVLLAQRIAGGTEPEESIVEVLVDPSTLVDDGEDLEELDLEEHLGTVRRPVALPR